MTVNGTGNVVVKITTEVHEDKGPDRCKAKAEQKIEGHFARKKELPKEVTVSNADFSKGV